MFRKIADAKDPERYQSTGIQKYRKTVLAFDGNFLKGTVSLFDAEETDDQVQKSVLSIGPNLSSLKTMAADLDHKASMFFRDHFNGEMYFSFDDHEAFRQYVPKMEQYFMHVLADRGVQGRVLRLNGFDFSLEPTNGETEETFKDALRKARDVEIFLTLQRGVISPRELIGRVLPCITTSLGVDHKVIYDVDEDNSSILNSVSYDYDQIGILQFQETEAGQIYFRRYSHQNGQPSLVFEGVLTTDVLQRHVCNWLVDALQEVHSLDPEEVFHLYGSISQVGGVNLQTSTNDPAAMLKVTANLDLDGPLN